LETNYQLGFCNKQHNRLTDPYGLQYKEYDSWKQNPKGSYFFILYFRDRDNPYITQEVKNNPNVYLILHDVLEGYAYRRFKTIHTFVDQFKLANKVYFSTCLYNADIEYAEWAKSKNLKRIFKTFYYPEWYHRVYDNYFDYKLSRFSRNKNIHYCSLNNRPHPHRIQTVDLLIERNMLDKGIVSSAHHSLTVDKGGSLPNDYNAKVYGNALINLVVETHYAETWNWKHHIFLSEKTWKPIACNQAFVIVGPRHTLKYLKTLGFLTFSCIIKESYDDEYDDTRLNSAVEALQECVNKYSVQELNKVTKQIRKHNVQNFLNIREKMIKTCW